MRQIVLFLSVVILTACIFIGCANPGQPPTIGNVVVGLVVIKADQAIINTANERLSAAYKAGKIGKAEYDMLYAEEQAAMTAFNNLGFAIIQNQTVTQAQVDAAVQTFITPLLSQLDKYLGPATLPAPLTQP